MTAPTPSADPLLLLQQQNLPAISSKLLHDLRNPVHSVRIGIELFARIARADEKTTAVLERAARYAAPAEASMSALAEQVERMTVYIGRPLAPNLQPIAVEPWLAEAAAVLKESTHKVDVRVVGAPAGARWVADRARLSHAVLHWCLANGEAGVDMEVSPEEPSCLGLSCRSRHAGARQPSGDETDLRARVLESGGGVVRRDDAVELRVSFEAPPD